MVFRTTLGYRPIILESDPSHQNDVQVNILTNRRNILINKLKHAFFCSELFKTGCNALHNG